MRILIDILHPAHVHVFRCFREVMRSRGHEVLVVSRVKDVTIPLLAAYGIDHEVGSTAARGWIGFARELAARTARVARLARSFRADVVTGCMGPSAAPAARAAGIPSVVLYNNETARLANMVAQSLATVYVTPQSYRRRVVGRHVRHSSFHELAYLHPNRFRPDGAALFEMGLRAGEPFALVRWVALASTHDRHVRGFEDRAAFVRGLGARMRVVISSEDPVPADLAPLRVAVAPERLHDVLAHAALCVGESATLAAEAAVLGVPAIYVADSPRGYLLELEEKWGLVQNAPSADRARAALERVPTPAECAERRRAMLEQRGDLTAWLVEYFLARAWENARGAAP